MVKFSAKSISKNFPKIISCPEVLSWLETIIFVSLLSEDAEEGFLPYGFGFEFLTHEGTFRADTLRFFFVHSPF
jgi:hypothetical protein